MSVKSACADRIDPGKRRRSHLQQPRRSLDCRRRHGGRLSLRDRPRIGARKDRDASIGLDADGKLGADQIEALRADPAAQQVRAGNADFRLRCARDDNAIGITNHNVENAYRGSPALIAFDLCAADRDQMLAAEILGDRLAQPWRHETDADGAGREPQPKAGHSNRDERGHSAGRDQRPLHPFSSQQRHGAAAKPHPRGVRRAQHRPAPRYGRPFFKVVRFAHPIPEGSASVRVARNRAANSQ